MTIKDIAILIGVLAGIYANLSFQDSLAADGMEKWTSNRLHNPSPDLLQREHDGNITIYDGLSIVEVNQAMDKQFDRIDSMMFVRTRHPAPEGQYEVEEDCD